MTTQTAARATPAMAPSVQGTPAPLLLRGSSARMLEVDSASAALVLTGPPYFPQQVEGDLLAVPTDAARIASIATTIEAYAWSLRPIFEECMRVLRPGGRLVLQTRDVRLRSRLVPVEAIHREVCEAVGFTLFARHFWRPPHTTRTRRRVLEALLATSGPAPFDPEVFLVFSKEGPTSLGRPEPEDIELLQQDFIRSATGRVPRRHRFQSPIPVMRALLRAYTAAGDLVVDPFAGGATVLRLAYQADCPSIGYEIDAAAIELAQANLSGLGATNPDPPDPAASSHEHHA